MRKEGQNDMKLKFKTGMIGIALLLTTQSVFADEWAKTNEIIVDKFAVPRFEVLLKTSKQLVDSTDSFCGTVSDENLSSFKLEFHKVMDAWQQAQILRSGPEELLMRSFRVEMWPDRSNTGAKQILKLLKAKDLDALKPDVFSRSSTAVQGLSAIERLVFAKGVKASDFEEGGKGNYRCQLLQAMSKNVNSISTDLLKEWETSYKETVTTLSEENDVFESHKEVASIFLKEATTQLQAVYDQKFKRPFDKKRFRLKRSESWRSGRSLRNIQLNLESAQELYQLGFSTHLKDAALKKKLEEEFRQAIETGKKFTDMDLKKAHDDHLEAVTKWMKEVSELKRTLTVDVPKALDIPLGFNSLDGD